MAENYPHACMICFEKFNSFDVLKTHFQNHILDARCPFISCSFYNTDLSQNSLSTHMNEQARIEMDADTWDWDGYSHLSHVIGAGLLSDNEFQLTSASLCRAIAYPNFDRMMKEQKAWDDTLQLIRSMKKDD